MPALKYLLVMLAACASAVCHAQITADALPAETKWYLRADLEALRTARSGKAIHEWLDGEVFVEIRDELGIDLSKEADSVTAFADANLGTIVVVEGRLAQQTREKLLAVAAADASLDMLSHGKQTYYHVSETGTPRTGHDSLDDLQESAFFTFDVKDKLIVTSNEGQMKTLLDNGGRLPGNHGHPGAIFVLTADRSFVQAGIRTDELIEEGGWDSNILQNTQQLALLISGHDELLSVEAQLVSREPQMAKSLADIANGLLSLQALNTELEPDLRDLLRTTRINVKDNVLSVNVVIDPNRVVAMLDE